MNDECLYALIAESRIVKNPDAFPFFEVSIQARNGIDVFRAYFISLVPETLPHFFKKSRYIVTGNYMIRQAGSPFIKNTFGIFILNRTESFFRYTPCISIIPCSLIYDRRINDRSTTGSFQGKKIGMTNLAFIIIAGQSVHSQLIPAIKTYLQNPVAL